jgi:hypothetical protein
VNGGDVFMFGVAIAVILFALALAVVLEDAQARRRRTGRARVLREPWRCPHELTSSETCPTCGRYVS